MEDLKLFNGLLDFYPDRYGVKYQPHSVSENWVYLRADTFGHIRNVICPRNSDGSPDWTRAKRYAEKYECLSFIFRQEGKHPERYVVEKAREILKRSVR